MSIYSLAIIGFGGMGSQHGELLKKVDRIKVEGIYDIDNKRKDYATENNFKSYESFEDVLNDKNVNIVLIATPNHVHKEIAIRAMEAGKNVICEKPVTLNSKELEEILEVSKKTGKLFVVHQNRRWDEDFLTMKKIYDEKLLGETFRIETRVQGSRGIPGDWRKEKQFGGGMMLDWGVHLIDRLLVMVNEKIKKVYCSMSYILGADCDDGFTLNLTFESGKTAVVEVGTSNFIALPKWYMAGTEGAAIIEDWEMNGRLEVMPKKDEADAKPIVAGAGLTKTMAPRLEGEVLVKELPFVKSTILDFYNNVIDVLEDKATPAIKNSEVMRVMKLIEAAFESHENGTVVYFE